MGKLAFGVQTIDLPHSQQMEFDFRAAIAEGGIISIERAPDCDQAWLETELWQLGIGRASSQ
ncbi:hypothetical protein LJR267_010649 [Paraburkholderia hospita]|uniref:hypothetical protein n=1 Tax=Paraburkholderia hospita TaxID=169430 RepID=UPI003ECDB753